MSIGTYSEAIAYIHAAYGRGAKVGLSNMTLIMDSLYNPQNAYPCAHVAGTNGKGSICAMMERAFRVNGEVTGLYTSPYLSRYNERIRINGESVCGDALLSGMRRIVPIIDDLRAQEIYPTEFEIGTALAFLCFKDAGVTRGVVEVGLGGRLDPTNIIWPDVSVIARIGLDHTAILGGTLPDIAREKAGIIKPNVPVVLMPQEDSVMDVIAGICANRHAKLYVPKMREVATALNGAHQKLNAATALEALRVVGVPDSAIMQGLAQVKWPGRLEWTQFGAAEVLIDGAHNAQGARALAEYVATLPQKDTALICAIMRDKASGDILDALRPITRDMIATVVDNVRCLSVPELAQIAQLSGFRCDISADISHALSLAAVNHKRIVICGSLYLVGEVRDVLNLYGADAI